MSKDVRKLITIKTISEINAIPNADAIEVATIGGWKIVVPKGAHRAGESVLYFEVDTFLPDGVPAWQFLVDKSSRTFTPEGGVELKGHVLKTIKMRGQISQGFILPLGFGLNADSTAEEISEVFTKLGVAKYEPPIAPGSDLIGGFPSKIARKTDSERVQNLTDEFLQSMDPTEWFASEKIDGSSATFWKEDGVLHGASRNGEISLEKGNVWSAIAKKLKLEEVLPDNAVIQGEVYGEGIQGNPLKIQGTRLAVFNYGFSVPTAHSEEVDTFTKWIVEHMVPTVPLSFPKTVEEAISQVDGMKSLLNPQVQAEGVVWWNNNGKVFAELEDRPNFKAINNVFLAKHDR